MRVGLVCLIAMLCVTLLPSLAQAADSSPEARAETFFSTLTAGSIFEAYDELFAGSPMASAKPQAIEVIKRQTASSLPLYGPIQSAEKVEAERFGSTVVRLVYLLNHELHPTVWEFFFYHTPHGWVLSHVTFNDEFKRLR